MKIMKNRMVMLLKGRPSGRTPPMSLACSARCVPPLRDGPWPRPCRPRSLCLPHVPAHGTDPILTRAAPAHAVWPHHVPPLGLAPPIAVTLHLPINVHAADKLHTSDLRATPWHRAPRRRRASRRRVSIFVQAASRCYAWKHMLQAYVSSVSYVSCVCYNCFIWMLQK
jgi:hypothetical protein